MEIGQKKNNGISKEALQDHKKTGAVFRYNFRKNEYENNRKIYLHIYAEDKVQKPKEN